MYRGFYFFILISMSSFCLGNAPPKERRLQRSKYVKSFIRSGDIGAEIGVFEGVFAFHVLLKKHPKKLYLIDPWEYGLQADVEKNPTLEKQKNRDAQYERVCGYFVPYKNVEIVRMKAEDAAYLFEDEYFDYVYIDGEHSYDAVFRDLSNYFPKVKIGGYLIGDDYGWTGIEPAVKDFVNDHKNACIFYDPFFHGDTGGQFAIKRIR